MGYGIRMLLFVTIVTILQRKKHAGTINRIVVPECSCRGPTFEAAMRLVGFCQKHAGTTIFVFGHSGSLGKRNIHFSTLTSHLSIHNSQFSTPLKLSNHLHSTFAEECYGDDDYACDSECNGEFEQFEFA